MDNERALKKVGSREQNSVQKKVVMLVMILADELDYMISDSRVNSKVAMKVFAVVDG